MKEHMLVIISCDDQICYSRVSWVVDQELNPLGFMNHTISAVLIILWAPLAHLRTPQGI